MTDCHYAVLQVKHNATAGQIRTSFKRLALQRHPDKGGCAEAFKPLYEAYTVLADPQERAAFDARGAEAANSADENFEEEESDDDESDDDESNDRDQS
eukprot:10137-Heterococcus_DN1.PRE.3